MASNFILFHGWSRKSQESQPPDQNSCNQMNYQINEVITDDIKLMKMIVKGKSKSGNKSAGPKIPDFPEIMGISYCKIISYGNLIIEMKCAMKRIGINNNS